MKKLLPGLLGAQGVLTLKLLGPGKSQVFPPVLCCVPSCNLTTDRRSKVRFRRMRTQWPDVARCRRRRCPRETSDATSRDGADVDVNLTRAESREGKWASAVAERRGWQLYGSERKI